MTKEDKELLLKDLSARLPYGVKAWEDDEYPPFTIIGYDGTDFIDNDGWEHRIGEFKPYLRLMSSMTDEEEKQFQDVNLCELPYMVEGLDWLNAHHFDYRGLIEKGLAIEALKGMYDKTNTKEI